MDRSPEDRRHAVCRQSVDRQRFAEIPRTRGAATGSRRCLDFAGPTGHYAPRQSGSTAEPRFRDRLKPLFALRTPAITLNTLCVAMAAMVLALVIWRVEIVRLLPQTATFYRLVGLEVNLRGLAFKDVKTSTETVVDDPVIEGMIVAQSRKPVELPCLRFSVRDAHETEIYAWNAVLEQAALKPGENVWFRTRLAAPPSEGRRIGVRFFNRQDLAAGNGA